MHRTAQDATQHNPKEGSRTIEHTHHGTKDGACTSNVEELHGIDLPSSHGDVVGTIHLGVAGSLSLRVGAKDLLHKAAVEEVSKHKTDQRNTKCKHLYYLRFEDLLFTI